jgi:hypothetical protein
VLNYPITLGDYPLAVGKKLWYPTPYFGFLVSKPDEENRMQFPPKLKDIVGFLYASHNGSFDPIGTAFFVFEYQADIGFYYLVTCKHVIKDFLDSGDIIHVRFNRNDGEGVDYIPLPDDWIYHEDEAVDLAVLPWMPPEVPDESTVIWAGIPIRDTFLSTNIWQVWGVSLYAD